MSQSIDRRDLFRGAVAAGAATYLASTVASVVNAQDSAR